MRDKLALLCGRRIRFRATISSYGAVRSSFGELGTPTVCLRNVTRTKTNEVVADHAWVVNPRLLGCSYGYDVNDIIEFTSRIRKYKKGYNGVGYDFGLAGASCIKHVDIYDDDGEDIE